MSAPSVLTATTRTETGKKVSGLRKAGRIPAVVFGHGLASIPVSLDAHEFEHFRRTAHSNLIVELKVDGKDKHRVLVHGVQVDPRTRQLLHVDLFELKSGEEVTIEIRSGTPRISQSLNLKPGVTSVRSSTLTRRSTFETCRCPPE